MNLGGDPTQALVHATTTGNFVVSLSSVDLGQGLKTVAAQVAAETLGLPYENIIVDTADTDTGPHCMGTFASRGTHRVGNAVIMAAQEAREAMLAAAAEKLEVDAEDLETDGIGLHQAQGLRGEEDPHRRPRAGRALRARAARSRAAASSSRSAPTRCPRRARWTRTPAQAHACTVADVEVDDETGVVEVLSLHNVYEVGRAINPAMAKQQIEGGAWMGISHALFETTEPYYPVARSRPAGLRGVPDARAGGQRGDGERRSSSSPPPAAPYGAKGIGEMTANAPIPAIANAIYDACGVRLTEMPFTPERVLRGLDELSA